MLNVTKELTALARKLGYTGKAPDTVAKAINAITASVGEGGGEGGGGCDCEGPLVVPMVELYRNIDSADPDYHKYFYYDEDSLDLNYPTRPKDRIYIDYSAPLPEPPEPGSTQEPGA